jgi:hypothetical protein
VAQVATVLFAAARPAQKSSEASIEALHTSHMAG